MRTHANKHGVRLHCEVLEGRALPATGLALAGANTLIRFDTATPNVVTTIGPVTGLVGGDTLIGLDIRPATGELFGLGSGSRIYVIDPATGVAVQRTGGLAFTLNGTSFGFDFNPVADRIRITSDLDQDIRVNPNDGGLVATDGTLAYAVGDPNAAANPNVVASGYTNSFGGSVATTLYNIDSVLNALVIQNPPNNGTLSTVGGLGIDALSAAGFDIQPLAGGGNAAFAVLSTNGTSSALYTINLTTGAATLVGSIGVGPGLVSGFTVVPEIVPTATLYGINDANGNLVRFNANNPSTVVSSVPVTGLVGGDTILAIDFRPATGQLYALGSGSRLYTIDAFTGAATQVVGGLVPFVLNGTSFGFDFNPVADRIRITSDFDQDIRVNPNDGGLVATDGTLAYAVGDPNAAANPNVVASAYTNSFAGAVTTTLYDLDTALDRLVIQNPPNSGTLNTVVGAGLGINAQNVTGFDIQTLAGGSNIAFAALTTDITTSLLYTIDLTTGVATQVGTTPIGGAAPLLLRGLAVAAAGSFQFSAPTYSVSEGGTVATITVTRTLGSDGIVSVTVSTTDGTATAPGDYTDSDQVLVFAPGVTSLTFTIPITSDALNEGNETVNLALSNATGGATLGTLTAAVLTITDDDPQPGVTLGLTGSPLSEAGGVATVTATLSAVSALPVTINLVYSGTAALGTDYTASATSIVIPAGMTTGTVTLNGVDNAVVAADKTIIVDVTSVTNGTETGTQQVTATITNDDVTPPAPLPTPVASGPVAAGPAVTVTRADGTTVTVNPFPGFTGVVTTASGDVNGDGVADVIAGAGINGHVKVFDGTTGAEIRSFLAFGAFTGSIYVASGDVNNDGFDDLIVGASINGHVKVLSGTDGAELFSFLAYAGFGGEVRVGSGDINGDGVADIITGAGSGARGHVKVFDGATGAEIRSFLAYTTFNGGIFVAGGDVNGDGRDDIVTGADANGHVKAFSGTDNTEVRSFLAFPGFAGSARVAARNVNGDAADDILVASGPGRAPVVRTFDGLTLALLSEVPVSDPLGQGVFVG